MHDVIIVGSGPAGLSAAVYTSRAGLDTMILSGYTPGGLVATTDQVDNYLGLNGMSGADMSEKFHDHALAFGADIIYDQVSRIEKHGDEFVVWRVGDEDTDSLKAKSVIYAAGSTPKKLGIQGEDLSGVSYCATCDGNFFKNVPVVVIGGGESAAEEALYMSHLASSVDVLIRSQWRASEPAVEKLEAQDNVHIHLGAVPIEFIENNNRLESVKLADGRVIPAQGAFIAIGQSPNSLSANGHVVLYPDQFISHSITEGFFVAGDICNQDYRQIAVAVGDGAKAGIDATAYIQNK